MEPLKRLEAVGFRRVGLWSPVSGKPVCTLEAGGATQNVVYAFVSGREVLYIGKTTQQRRKWNSLGKVREHSLGRRRSMR